MVILRTQSQVSSFLKRNQKNDYNSTTYDIGSAWVDAKETKIDGDKVVEMTTRSSFWDQWRTYYVVLAIIKINKK